MTHSQHEILFSEFSRALNESPRYGTVSFIVHFVDGEVSRIERGKVEEFQIGQPLEQVKPEAKKELPQPKTPEHTPSKLLSKKDVASMLGISISTLHRSIASGEIRVVRIGGRVLVSTVEIDRLMGKNFIAQ